MKPILDNWDAVMDPLRKATRPLSAMSILAENQFVQWERLDNELIDQILESKNVNKVLRIRNEKEKYRSTFEITEECLQHHNMEGREVVFEQSIEAFQSGLYELAVIGLTASIDGVLANVYTNDSVIRIDKRVRTLLDRVNNIEDFNDAEYSTFALTYTIDKMTDSFAESSDFSGPEPKLLNRHWIMHGRSKRKKTKLDCVKLIRYLYGLLLLRDIAKEEGN